MGSLWRVVRRGKNRDVCCVVTDQLRCKVDDFLKPYRKSNKKACVRMKALFEDIADHGLADLDRQKCELLRGKVIELKDQKDGLRFFGFSNGKRRDLLVIERGWKKGPRKEQDIQIDAVIKFMNEYVSEQWPVDEKRKPLLEQ